MIEMNTLGVALLRRAGPPSEKSMQQNNEGMYDRINDYGR